MGNKVSKVQPVVGSVELLYRKPGLRLLEPGQYPDLHDYEPACRSFGMSEFDDPFAIMEWCHDHPACGARTPNENPAPP